jgi:hypothetical protein
VRFSSDIRKYDTSDLTGNEDIKYGLTFLAFSALKSNSA